jgi:sugar/nucleoside kinase (ribokinase family)
MSNRRIVSRKASRGNREFVVLGTGLVSLDIVISDRHKPGPLLCTGGTCGNVLTALAFLGWKSYPIARLGFDFASKRIMDDLKLWGVGLDFVTFSATGSTPIIIQRIRRNRAGEPSHYFSRKCPLCNSRLPWYKAVRAFEVSDLEPRLPKANVFFFDRTSRGAITLAQVARKAGSLVFFEPSSASDNSHLAEALATSHIVKLASDRVKGNAGALEATVPLLVIETLGADGLRFRLGRSKTSDHGEWHRLHAFNGGGFRDAAGAGDWCTAGIISRIGALGPTGVRKLGIAEMAAALKYGQAMASWACRFEGARGGMYESSKADFVNAVEEIGKGQTKLDDWGQDPPALNRIISAVWCKRCQSRNRR